MSKAVSALGGVSHKGFVDVAEAGQRGMITVRGDLGSAAMKKAVKAAVGTAVPAPRRIELAGEKGAAWMSPDELLILVPYAEAVATVEVLERALGKEHHLVADVSDARAVFRIKGAKAREDFNPGPIDGVDLSDLPPLPDDLPPLPDAGAAAPVGKDQAAKPEPKPDRAEQLPPLPERSLGLDL